MRRRTADRTAADEWRVRREELVASMIAALTHLGQSLAATDATSLRA